MTTIRFSVDIIRNTLAVSVGMAKRNGPMSGQVSGRMTKVVVESKGAAVDFLGSCL